MVVDVRKYCSVYQADALAIHVRRHYPLLLNREENHSHPKRTNTYLKGQCLEQKHAQR